MTFDESKPLAKQLAENELKKHFDTEAFLILSLLSLMPNEPKQNDLVPESKIDECIQKLLELFVTYYNNKNEQNLDNLLITLRQILSELYHTCISDKEREKFKEFIVLSQNIIQ